MEQTAFSHGGRKNEVRPQSVGARVKQRSVIAVSGDATRVYKSLHSLKGDALSDKELWTAIYCSKIVTVSEA